MRASALRWGGIPNHAEQTLRPTVRAFRGPARTPRNYQGNVRAGVRYLRWQLDEFGGDRRLALAGWYQGARAVRERGLFDDTKEFVRIVLALYGTV